MRTVAIVPVKALESAKGRLAPVLSASQRRELVEFMLDRVLDACTAAATIDTVLVVTGDEQGAALVAGRRDVEVLVVVQEGLPAAMTAADKAVADAVDQSLVVAADLPYVTAGDIDAFVAAAGTTGDVVVVSRTGDGGTGALLRRPPDVVRTAFGPGSADAHIALARDAGIAWISHERAGLVMDVDTPAQLAALKRDVVACPPG